MRRTLLALCLLAGSAAAHQAPSSFEYDPECCSGADCQPVPDEAVREVQGGYRVVIAPGTHRFAEAQPLEFFIPHGSPKIRPSGDGHKHACLRYGILFCVYLPPGGV